MPTNPQMVHITIEVVAFLALIFWITSGQKRTNFHIKSLLQKVSEQEDRILKLEMALKKAITPRASNVVKVSPVIVVPEVPDVPEISIEEMPEEEHEELEDFNADVQAELDALEWAGDSLKKEN
jgi:hypothetical protein